MVLAYSVFFQMWTTQAHPYNQIAEGDIVYIGDVETRQIAWEVSVTNLLVDFRYETTREALGALRNAYGLYAEDLNDYHRSRSGHGWLLAWAPKVHRRVDLELPPGQHFGRNGYRVLDPEDRSEIGLEATRRRALARPPDWYEPRAATSTRSTPVARYIPLHVRQAVARRDGNRCVGCGTKSNLHFDHVHPFSRGGQSTVDNLRLLCERSNLAKGAKGGDQALACTSS